MPPVIHSQWVGAGRIHLNERLVHTRGNTWCQDWKGACCWKGIESKVAALKPMQLKLHLSPALIAEHNLNFLATNADMPGYMLHPIVGGGC